MTLIEYKFSGDATFLPYYADVSIVYDVFHAAEGEKNTSIVRRQNCNIVVGFLLFIILVFFSITFMAFIFSLLSPSVYILA